MATNVSGRAVKALPLDGNGDLRAIDPGHMEIQQGDVVLLVAQGFQGLPPVNDGIDLMATLAQKKLQQIRGNRAVFRDEDFAAGGGLRCGFNQELNSTQLYSGRAAEDRWQNIRSTFGFYGRAGM